MILEPSFMQSTIQWPMKASGQPLGGNCPQTRITSGRRQAGSSYRFSRNWEQSVTAKSPMTECMAPSLGV